MRSVEGTNDFRVLDDEKVVVTEEAGVDNDVVVGDGEGGVGDALLEALVAGVGVGGAVGRAERDGEELVVVRDDGEGVGAREGGEEDAGDGGERVLADLLDEVALGAGVAPEVEAAARGGRAEDVEGGGGVGVGGVGVAEDDERVHGLEGGEGAEEREGGAVVDVDGVVVAGREDEGAGDDERGDAAGVALGGGAHGGLLVEVVEDERARAIVRRGVAAVRDDERAVVVDERGAVHVRVVLRGRLDEVREVARVEVVHARDAVAAADREHARVRAADRETRHDAAAEPHRLALLRGAAREVQLPHAQHVARRVRRHDAHARVVRAAAAAAARRRERERRQRADRGAVARRTRGQHHRRVAQPHHHDLVAVGRHEVLLAAHRRAARQLVHARLGERRHHRPDLLHRPHALQHLQRDRSRRLARVRARSARRGRRRHARRRLHHTHAPAARQRLLRQVNRLRLLLWRPGASLLAFLPSASHR